MDKIDGGEVGLPLGMVCSGLLLSTYTIIKSSISLLLMAARQGSTDGFPFLFETVLIFPFAMQAIAYTSQTCMTLGFKSGFEAIKAASSSMGPCLFYACFIVSTTLMETYSLQFISPSTFVVLKQLTMVVIAIGEVLVLSVKPSQRAWMLIFAQVLCVALFQYSVAQPQGETHHIPSVIIGGTPSLPVHRHASLTLVAEQERTILGMSVWASGMTACMISIGTGGFGSILQQRFMQRQAKHVPVSIKLLYQHVLELFLVMVVVQSRTEDRHHLWTNGFFSGWNHYTFVVTVTMWFAFLCGSAISANISAIAGAFAIAVSVALTGVLECVIFGRTFSQLQFGLMALVCCIALLYTRERVAMLSVNDPEQKRLVEDTPLADARAV